MHSLKKESGKPTTRMARHGGVWRQAGRQDRPWSAEEGHGAQTRGADRRGPEGCKPRGGVSAEGLQHAPLPEPSLWAHPRALRLLMMGILNLAWSSRSSGRLLANRPHPSVPFSAHSVGAGLGPALRPSEHPPGRGPPSPAARTGPPSPWSRRELPAGLGLVSCRAKRIIAVPCSTFPLVFGAELCPQIEVLTPQTSECARIWK